MNKNEGTSRRLLKKKSVAEMLDTSVRTIDRLIASGSLPKVQVLGGVRIPMEAVEKLIQEGAQ